MAALLLATVGVSIGVVVDRNTHPETSHVGKLAPMLAHGDANGVAKLITPAYRSELSADKLQASRDAVTGATGPLQRVVRTVTVHERDTRHELEILSFSRGTGVLSAVRASKGITALVLLAGTSFDQGAAGIARAYADDLTTGDFSRIRAAFDPTMLAALPTALLASETRAGISRLQAPVSVVAQVTADRSPYVVVETYLLFRNGLRRVEITLDPDDQIAGMYLRNV